jgi:hypothetical protein
VPSLIDWGIVTVVVKFPRAETSAAPIKIGVDMM